MSRVLKISEQEYQSLLDKKILKSTHQKSEFCATVQQYINYIDHKKNHIKPIKIHPDSCEIFTEEGGVTEHDIIKKLDEIDTENKAEKDKIIQLALNPNAIREPEL